MLPDQLRNLLQAVRTGELAVESAVSELADLPFAELGYATVDHHRALRQGVPEVIFGQGKTAEQIVGIAREVASKRQNVLITRIDSTLADSLRQQLPDLRYAPLARVATLEFTAPKSIDGSVALVCAGTTDLPVAEECAETLRVLGISCERLTDVGVAGLHRLLAQRKLFDRVSLAIVVAGMEGALPSVVGGLVSIPVIAVPTSVGYGAGAGGWAALLGMLSSCAAGITVCNIDNGFGAAMAAYRILKPRAHIDSHS
jgi:NCAIR mutase (PurE)-related protein